MNPRTPPDTLARIFLALGQHYNTNSNQVLVVQGDLDLERLQTAVHTAVLKFDHVLRQPDDGALRWRPQDVPVREVLGTQRCSLQSETFRDALLALSEQHRIDWSRQPATQVFLIRSHDRQTCCVYLNSAHAAADAASDCMLVAEIIAQYSAPRSVTPAPAYAALPSVAPHWFSWSARLKCWLAAWMDIACANLSHDRGLALPKSGRWGYAPERSQARFATSVLPQHEVDAARRAAKRAGVTLNAVFAAALMRHLAQRHPGALPAAFRLSLALSLRALLPAPGRERAFGNHIVTCTLRQKPQLSAREQVRHLHEAVQQLKAQRVQIEVGRLALALPFMGWRLGWPLTRRAMARAQIANVCYSNPGVITQDFSSFGSPAHVVLEYTGLGCLVSPYDLMFYTTTVNGRTQLDALYRSECFSDIDHELLLPYRLQLAQLVAELQAQAVPTQAEPAPEVYA